MIVAQSLSHQPDLTVSEAVLQHPAYVTPSAGLYTELVCAVCTQLDQLSSLQLHLYGLDLRLARHQRIWLGYVSYEQMQGYQRDNSFPASMGMVLAVPRTASPASSPVSQMSHTTGHPT